MRHLARPMLVRCCVNAPTCEEVDLDSAAENESFDNDNPKDITAIEAADAMNTFSAMISRLSDEYSDCSAPVMEKKIKAAIHIITEHWHLHRNARGKENRPVALSKTEQKRVERLRVGVP